MVSGQPRVFHMEEQAKAVLWLSGNPGCGKSVLSSTIVVHQQQRLTSSQDSQVFFYYFFDFNDKAKCTVEGLVRSLIYQVYCEIPDARGILESLYSSCQNGKSQPALGSLSQSLRKMLDQARPVYILMDALDECGDREKHQADGLLPCLQHLYNSSPNMHLLITSRPEQDIMSFIHGWVGERAQLSLQSSRVSSDICRYVHARVKEHSGLRRWRDYPKIQQEIETALTAKADGMFRWVVCQLDALEKCLDLPTLRKALDSLPSDLDETYAQIVQRIPPQYLPHAIRILQLLLFADQPLRLEAAVDALATNPDENPRFNPDNKMPDPKEITVYCSSLVSLTPQLDSEDWEGQGRRARFLRFAHLSVKEWLISKRLDSNFATGLDEIATRTSIARVCLSYLIELKSCEAQYNRAEYITDKMVAMRRDEQARPFGKYATKFWREHALFVESTAQQVRDMVLEFF
jgi:hypothetical protein